MQVEKKEEFIKRSCNSLDDVSRAYQVQLSPIKQSQKEKGSSLQPCIKREPSEKEDSQ